MISYIKYRFFTNDISDLEWTDFVPYELERSAITHRQQYRLLKQLMKGEFDHILREDEIFEEWARIKYRWE